jgi:ankyrin repeat protein
MNNLPDKNQIKDLILNDIKKKIYYNISNGDTTITIPVYVYDMFKDEFEDKGYTIIKKENDNYKISIPLVLLKNKKEIITNDNYEKIINITKQFDELLNYVKFNLKNVNFKKLLRNCKNENILKYVIDNAIDLECEGKYKMRPIHYICGKSTPEMIKYIIDKGVNLECADEWLRRPIHLICSNSTPEMIKYIIDKGVDLECKDFNEWRPIHCICRFSTPEIIKYIIDKGVNLECEIEDGQRPIHFICTFSTPEMIKYIIDKNVNIKFDNNLRLELNVKENNKLSDEEKNDIIEYIKFKILTEKYKNT